MSNDVIVKVNNFISDDEIKVLRQYCEGTDVDWNVGGQPSDTIWYNRVVQAAQLPRTSPIRRLLYSIAARTRRQIETYGTGPLYLQTLQIVKWQKGDNLDPPHADAEHVDPNYPEPHSFPMRHYSALVYINDDYEGGEIYFVNQNLKPKIEPGMLVHFTGKREDLHGVTEVTRGLRYTIPMWFTRDKQFEMEILPEERAL